MEIKLSQCFVAVDDHACDAAFGHIQASGADVLRAPIDQPYGVRDCAFRAPAGDMLRFARRRSG